MGPTLFCTRVPCFVGIPGAPDLGYQWSLEGSPADAQSETGHSQGVAGAAVSSEGLTKGGSVSKLSHWQESFLPGLRTPSVPCLWASP